MKNLMSTARNYVLALEFHYSYNDREEKATFEHMTAILNKNEALRCLVSPVVDALKKSDIGMVEMCKCAVMVLLSSQVDNPALQKAFYHIKSAERRRVNH